MSDPAAPAPLRREWWLLLACLIGAAALVQSGMTARLDHIVYDLLLSRRPPPPTDAILIVAVDERSLTEVGAWPWPRAAQAQLVRRIAAARPRAIGIDVLLTEPREAAADADLAAAIAQAGNVFLPLALTIPGRNGQPVDLTEPLPAFRRAAAGLGHVNLSPDSDGVMRTAYLAYGAAGQTWPALPAAMLGRRGTGQAPSADVSRSGPVLIDYPGPSGTLASVSAASVLRGEVPAELLAGKLVLVGITAAGLGDMHAAPFSGESPLLPGVEIQGSLLATLMAQHALTPAGEAWRLAFAMLPLVLLFVAMAWLPTSRGPLVAAGLILAAALASAVLLFLADLWLPPAAAMIALAASYALWAWRRLAVASRFVTAELERATAEAGPLGGRLSTRGGTLDRQLALLAATTSRERELRDEHDAVIQLLSHDMRAPQSAIIALLDSGGELEPALAGRIRQHARRTLELADGFVHLSRAQLVTLDRELVDLAELARDAADAIWAQAQARGMTVEVEVAGAAAEAEAEEEEQEEEEQEVLVRGDRSLLTRALINLLDNAVKYGEAGTRVAVSLASEGDQALAEVCNSGPDIPADQLDRIFAAFARAPGSARQVDGVGLGLSFVGTVATRHGGTVTCRSAAGRTCFSLVLAQTSPEP